MSCKEFRFDRKFGRAANYYHRIRLGINIDPDP